MRFLYDFFPIILFFVVYKVSDLYAATGVAILATLLQVTSYWFKHRKFDKMQLTTLVLIALLGGATLSLRNPIFIKWKPSVVYWTFALAFLGSHFIGKKPLIQRIMESKISLPPFVWNRLNMSWLVFFTVMGGVNLYVVYHFNTNAWVNFKLFGMLGITFLFVLLQALFLSRYMIEKE